MPDEGIFGRTNPCRDFAPAQSLLAEFQSAAGIDFDSRPSKADAASLGCPLPRHDPLTNGRALQFCDRCKNRETILPVGVEVSMASRRLTKSTESDWNSSSALSR